MKILVLRVFAFVVTGAICAFALWLDGYDFDERGGDVAFSFVLCLAISAIAALFPFELIIRAN